MGKPIVTRVVDRFLAVRIAQRFSAMAPEKMKELLLKLRKGADSSVSMKQLIEALTYLGGWKVEPFVGLVQMHGYGTSKNDADENKPEFEVEEDAELVKDLWKRVKQDEVQSFPSSPKHGQRYTMDVTDPEVWPAGGFYKNDRTGFYFKHYMGWNGLRFTSPEGKVFELLPSKFDVRDNRYPNPMKMPIWDIKAWLRKDTKFLEQISNNLGMPTYEDERREKSTPRTRDNTGTCPCCFRNIKLKDRGSQHPVIVLHGYQRPGWGSVQGQCIGVDFPPFELSPEGTKHLVKLLKKHLDEQRDWIRKLKSGDVTELYEQGSFRSRKMTPESEGPARWADLIESRISQAESLAHALDRDIDLLSKLISEWKEQPLPFEGQKVKPPPAFLR